MVQTSVYCRKEFQLLLFLMLGVSAQERETGIAIIERAQALAPEHGQANGIMTNACSL
jgi:hypothetical protein